MMANSSISLLIDGIRGASKFLHRDYFELESLQSSTKSTTVFVNKARERALENLQKSLGKYYKTIIFSEEDVIPFPILNQTNELDFSNDVVFVEVLDGSSNFARAIPFFAVVATLLKKKDEQVFAEKVVMNFPALGDIYYAEKGKGAWLEKQLGNFSGAFRLRMSATSKLEDSLVSCNHHQLSFADKISSNIRMFESCAYQLALLISGKSDCGLFPYKPLLYKGFELLICESGGGSHLKNDIVVASNYALQEKLKQVNL